MNYDAFTVEQLDAILNDLDAERQAVRERAREVMAARHRRIVAEQAAAHGLTPQLYEEARARVAEGVPLTQALADARRGMARHLQTVGVLPASLSARAKGT